MGKVLIGCGTGRMKMVKKKKEKRSDRPGTKENLQHAQTHLLNKERKNKEKSHKF